MPTPMRASSSAMKLPASPHKRGHQGPQQHGQHAARCAGSSGRPGPQSGWPAWNRRPQRPGPTEQPSCVSLTPNSGRMGSSSRLRMERSKELSVYPHSSTASYIGSGTPNLPGLRGSVTARLLAAVHAVALSPRQEFRGVNRAMAQPHVHPLWGSLSLDRAQRVSLQDQIAQFFRSAIADGRVPAGRRVSLLAPAGAGFRRFAHHRRGGLRAPGGRGLLRHAPRRRRVRRRPRHRSKFGLQGHGRGTAARADAPRLDRASTRATTSCRLRPACPPSTAFPGPPGHD